MSIASASVCPLEAAMCAGAMPSKVAVARSHPSADRASIDRTCGFFYSFTCFFKINEGLMKKGCFKKEGGQRQLLLSTHG